MNHEIDIGVNVYRNNTLSILFTIPIGLGSNLQEVYEDEAFRDDYQIFMETFNYAEPEEILDQINSQFCMFFKNIKLTDINWQDSYQVDIHFSNNYQHKVFDTNQLLKKINWVRSNAK